MKPPGGRKERRGKDSKLLRSALSHLTDNAPISRRVAPLSNGPAHHERQWDLTHCKLPLVLKGLFDSRGCSHG